MKTSRQLVALMSAVALLSATLLTAVIGTATAFASTSLHESQQGANSATFNEQCDGPGPTDGSVIWHFVLVQTTALSTAAS